MGFIEFWGAKAGNAKALGFKAMLAEKAQGCGHYPLDNKCTGGGGGGMARFLGYSMA